MNTTNKDIVVSDTKNPDVVLEKQTMCDIYKNKITGKIVHISHKRLQQSKYYPPY